MNTFIFFTHCDDAKAKPDNKFIRSKLASLKKHMDLEIPEENVVLFDHTKKSLEDFVANMVRGSISVA